MVCFQVQWSCLLSIDVLSYLLVSSPIQAVTTKVRRLGKENLFLTVLEAGYLRLEYQHGEVRVPSGSQTFCGSLVYWKGRALWCLFCKGTDPIPEVAAL